MAAACARGFITHGAGTRAIHSATVSWLSTCTKSGQVIPAERARFRIASLSRKALAVVCPMPGTCRYSRSMAASSTSKSSSATIRSMRLRLRDVGGALADVCVGHVAAQVEELVDRLARPVGLAQLLLGQEQDAAALPVALSQEFITLAVGGDAGVRSTSSLKPTGIV